MSLVIGAGTNHDQTKGNAASNFSFKGADPGPYVEIVTSSAAAKAESDIRLARMKDYKSLATVFSLELPHPAGSAGLETSVVISRYSYTTAGDHYLESLLFAYARYLFISSSRENSLPPNLRKVGFPASVSVGCRLPLEHQLPDESLGRRPNWIGRSSGFCLGLYTDHMGTARY